MQGYVHASAQLQEGACNIRARSIICASLLGALISKCVNILFYQGRHTTIRAFFRLLVVCIHIYIALRPLTIKSKEATQTVS